MTLHRTYELSEPFTVKLSGAVGKRETLVDRVELRKPTGNDLLLLDKFQGKPVGLRIELIARMSGLTLAQVRKLPAEDVIALAQIAIDGIVTPEGEK